jgi:hypothetical protein
VLPIRDVCNVLKLALPQAANLTLLYLVNALLLLSHHELNLGHRVSRLVSCLFASMVSGLLWVSSPILPPGPHPLPAVPFPAAAPSLSVLDLAPCRFVEFRSSVLL